MVTPPLPDGQHVSFCFLYNIVLENQSVQNSPWGRGSISSYGLLRQEIKFDSALPKPLLKTWLHIAVLIMHENEIVL